MRLVRWLTRMVDVILIIRIYILDMVRDGGHGARESARLMILIKFLVIALPTLGHGL